MIKIIAISNEKGGVAKTTTTISLGAALVDLGYHVLLVDLDAQANLTLALGLEPGESEITSSNIMLDNAPLLSARRKTDVKNLDLIPSNSRIETSEQFLPVRTNYTLRLPPCPRRNYTKRTHCRKSPAHPNASGIFLSICATQYDDSRPAHTRRR
jgi:cellulose biosynthesis protein BcsQ